MSRGYLEVAAAMACCGWVASAAGQTVLYSNGPWLTGSISANSTAAPAGTMWSELGRDGAAANQLLGFPAANGAPTYHRVADDFVVPAGAGGGAGWHIERIRVIAYEIGSGTASPFTGITLRIFNGRPTGGTAGGQVVFGDESTNRLHSTSFAGAYRIANSVVPFACGGPPAQIQLDRPLMEVVASVNQTFPPGTYWFDVSLIGTPNVASSVIATTALSTRQVNSQANALRRASGQWIDLIDLGVGCQPVPLWQDVAFEIIGTPAAGGCYANCDGSTQQPVLNVADFGCFLSKFAAGDLYANCDGSTQPPVLNVADFGCFLGKFAAGCR